MFEQITCLLLIVSALFILKFCNNLVRLYVLGFIAYFYIGWVFARNIPDSQLNLYNICIALLLLGVLFSNVILNVIKNNSAENLQAFDTNNIRYNPLFIFVLGALLFIAIASYITLILLHGIPILNISARKEVSGVYTYLVGLIWILYPFIFCISPKRYLLFFTVCTLIIMLTMGYRTPLVLTLLMFFILNWKYKRFNLSNSAKFFALLLMLSIVTLYPLLRFQDDPEAIVKLLGNLDLPPEWFILAPSVLVFAEGAGVVKGITIIVEDAGFQYGKFTLSGFSTILPGEQTHSRTLLSYWLGRKNWQESTTTSSIIGQYYMEFGAVGAFILSFVSGLLIAIGSNRFLFKSSIFTSAPFLIVFSLFLISIHTGMLDPIVIYVLLIHGLLIFSNSLGNVVFK